MLLTTTAISLLAAIVSAVPLEIYSNDMDLTNQNFDWSRPVNDQKIIKSALDVLTNIDNSTNIDACGKCKSRLMYGKALAASRPDLIPDIYEKWCLNTGNFSASTCATNYHRNTADNSTTGSNFADMLTLINPLSIDAEYFCYYKAGNQCPLPKLPQNLSISYLWNNTKPAKANKVLTPGNETMKVLHISDFHIELDYTVGAEANCSTSMCCTPHSKTAKGAITSNLTSVDDLYSALFQGSFYDADGTYHQGEKIVSLKNISIPATTFGNYECDAPEVLINSSLHSIGNFQKKNNISFDFAIFTGDLVDHDEIQYTSYEQCVEAETIIFRDIKNAFNNIPVYPVLGNHDTFPYGQLAPYKSGFQAKFDWNADLMAELWSDFNWIDWDQAQVAKTHYTGYSVNLKSGLKIVAFNSNAWYQKNDYAYINTVEDPDYFGVFEFLVGELLEAEKNDQRVWLIFHIPISQTMLPPQAKLFTDLVERFSPYTLAHIFNGHTHRDEFQILYKNNNGTVESHIENDAVNFAYITQAVTPWVENNPAWRYYEIDTKTFQVMNVFNYYTRLNDTFSSDGEPIWEFEYSPRTSYPIQWPQSAPLNATYWHRVYQGMLSNTTLLQEYEGNAKRWSPFTPDCSSKGVCNIDLCYVSSFIDDEYEKCLKKYNYTTSS
jgi:3',5'-cyclic AMP phosphodiesterase CpdA